ncbi:M23 family metallopeptidase [Leptolyngbya sp. KIOST-1]|uniref:M23 family metallopeptidase n=1 Tax=Leptolyngbya sp. KIOST-1 TaxID=1229172 RepID=UPI0009DCD380|nr:M23 family metallopeptidase [Leptolyngbya sp. KIOST-1]
MIGRLRSLPQLSLLTPVTARWAKTAAHTFTRVFKSWPRPKALLGLGVSTAVAVALLMPRSLPPAIAQDIAAALWTRASFPVEDFQTYTSPFGYRSDPYSGSPRFHYGLDLAAPNGSYIRNWWTGEVLWVEDQGACGTSLAIKSGEWTHIYCHMHGHVEGSGQNKVLVDRNGGIQLRPGQTVPAGARIGRVGMTGRTTGPHLHWGLKYQDNWVDPALVLRAMYVGQQAAL